MAELLGNMLVIFLLAPAITCLVELPIIRFLGVTKHIPYIIVVNVLTNLVLNLSAFLLNILNFSTVRVIWILAAEIVFVPWAEIWLYKLQSKTSFLRIIWVTYLANAASFFIGWLILGNPF